MALRSSDISVGRVLPREGKTCVSIHATPGRRPLCGKCPFHGQEENLLVPNGTVSARCTGFNPKTHTALLSIETKKEFPHGKSPNRHDVRRTIEYGTRCSPDLG